MLRHLQLQLQQFSPFYCLLGNVFFGIFPRLAAQSKHGGKCLPGDAGCSAIYIRIPFDLVFVFELCVSLYNLQLSFILQLFFAPRTFVYMANSRSTRCHTHTWTNAYDGAKAASVCFSWLPRPPTDGLRHCSPPPLRLPFSIVCSLSKVLLHQSFCYASLSFFGPLQSSSQNLSRLLFLRRAQLELESKS